jgi:excisionase family DNA binding protein
MPKALPRSGSVAVRLLTVKEIAELDGTSEKTVRRAVEAGLLEVLRVGPGGRLIRIHPDAHAAYRHAYSRRY